jgi:predicted AAA+ superfamily ATPase
MLHKLLEIHEMVVEKRNQNVKRYLYHSINWDLKALCIFGARGTGKTTLMIQHYHDRYKSPDKALYISADHVFVNAHGLYEIADQYFKSGGEALYIDEIHKYPNWTVELKNILDVYSHKQIIVSGSSTIDLKKSKGDLSRRLVYYELMGLSFREFLRFESGVNHSTVSLDDLIHHHYEISKQLIVERSILREFKNYLKYGYYPFFLEGKKEYISRLTGVIEKVIFEDIASSFNLSQPKLPVIKKLLWLIANSEPFVPNIDRISKELGISREYVYHYIEYLEKAGLIINLYRDGTGFKVVRKPAKIFIQNTGLIKALSEKTDDNMGAIRETFFANQLFHMFDLRIPEQGDFLVLEKYRIEIGGKNKKIEQIRDIPNSFLALDDIEIGFQQTIPLYLFGFLY